MSAWSGEAWFLRFRFVAGQYFLNGKQLRGHDGFWATFLYSIHIDSCGLGGSPGPILSQAPIKWQDDIRLHPTRLRRRWVDLYRYSEDVGLSEA